MEKRWGVGKERALCRGTSMSEGVHVSGVFRKLLTIQFTADTIGCTEARDCR